MSPVRGWGPERHFFILPPAQLKETIRGKSDRATKSWKMDFRLVVGETSPNLPGWEQWPNDCSLPSPLSPHPSSTLGRWVLGYLQFEVQM